MSELEDDLFDNGALYQGSFLLKAHLKVPVRAPSLPVARDLVERARDIVAARYNLLHADINGVLEFADARKSLGLFITPDRKLGSDLFKAAKVTKAPKKPAAPPKANLSGQPRGSADYKRPQGGVHAPGSRGGKWYRDKKGNIRYGNAPHGDFQHELTPEETAEHISHFRPSPFMGGTHTDAELVSQLLDPKFQKKLGLDPLSMEMLSWWYGEKSKDGSFEGGGVEMFMKAYGLTEDDMKGDLSKLKLWGAKLEDGTVLEGGTFQDAVVEFLGTVLNFGENPDTGEEYDFENEVRPHIDAAFKKFEEAKKNPLLQKHMQSIGQAVEEEGYTFFFKAANHDADMAKLGDIITAEPNPETQATTLAAALGALDLLMVPKAGETQKDASLKGSATPNAVLFGPSSPLMQEPERWHGLSVPQLMAIVVGGMLYEGFDNAQRVFVYTNSTNEVMNQALLHIQGRMGLNPATAKVLQDQIKSAANTLIKQLNLANIGQNPGMKDFIAEGADVMKDPEKAKALQEHFANLSNLRKDALEAQKNDSFDLAGTMNPDTKLMQHQRQSVNWMNAVKRGVLALDAGMGKTLTVISFMEKLKEKKPGHKAILFLPPSLMMQWPDEIAKFAPGAKNKILNLAGLSMEDRKAALQSGAAKSAEYILISTGTLNNPGEGDGTNMDENDGSGGTDNEMIELLKGLDGAVFIDEVHQGGYKTGDSIRHEIAKKVIGAREYAFGMTATPMPNSPMDLFHLTNLFAPKTIGKQEEWEGATHNMKFNELTNEWYIANPQRLTELRDRTKPFVFYKSITDPAVEADMNKALPPLVHNNQRLEVQSNHPMYKYLAPGGIIDHMVQARIAELEEENGYEYSKQTKTKLTKLLAVNLHRQACISPELIDPSYKGESIKLKRMVADVVAHFKGGLGKEDKPLVIFSSFPQSAFPVLRRELAKAGIDPSLVGEIHGGKNSKERAFEQDMTNTGKRKVLLVGTMSGGAGLNLQKMASKMMFMDEPWHPSAKRQALGRVWRTGQKADNVQCINYRIGIENGVTWDEQTEGKLAGKQTLVTAMLSDVDLATDAFHQLADAHADQLLGSAQEAKTSAGKAKNKKKFKVDSAKISQMLKNYYGEEFQDVSENESDSAKIPDIDKKFGDHYKQYLDKKAQGKLKDEAPHIANEFDHYDAWHQWNQEFKQKNAGQSHQIKLARLNAAEETKDIAKIQKVKDQIRDGILEYRGWAAQIKQSAADAYQSGDKAAAKEFEKRFEDMKKNFPEAFEKHDWETPTSKATSSKAVELNAGKSKPTNSGGKSEKAKAEAKPQAKKLEVKTPQKATEFVSQKNAFKKKDDPVAHALHEALLGKKHKDEASVMATLEKQLSKMGVEKKDLKSETAKVFKYLKKNKVINA